MNTELQQRVAIGQLAEGQRVDQIFLVKECRRAETRAGKPYLLLTLTDKSGEVSGPVWEDAEQLYPICQKGRFLQISGLVQSYREQKQLKIESVTSVDEQGVDVSQFVAVSPRDLDEMAEELQDLIRSVENTFLKKLLGKFFKKGEIWSKFQTAPAAKAVHHAYVGGLMEHSLSVGKLADSVVSHYRGVDRSLLIAGALLHDIGKLEELEMEIGVVSYTDAGRLKGHVVMGCEMVAQVAGQIKDFPDEVLVKLQHLILSHHGKMEFGAPTIPMTVESFILHHVDDLDAKMNLMEQLREKLTSSELQWTEYQRTLERYLFLGGYEDDTDIIGEEPPPVIQKSLF